MAGPYGDWLKRARQLQEATPGELRLRDIPIDMLVDVHNAIARIWKSYQDEAARASSGRAGARLPEEISWGLRHITGISYELDLWQVERSRPATAPVSEPGLYAEAKPPQHLPCIYWPAEDGGLIVATVSREGDSLTFEGAARAIPGDLRIDERLLNAVEVVTAAEWRPLLEREEQATPEQVRPAPRPTVQAKLGGEDVSWAAWLRHAMDDPPPAIRRAIGTYPEEPRLQKLWRHAALQMGHYEARHGQFPPSEMADYVRSLTRADGASGERNSAWASIQSLRRARRELGGHGEAGVA